VLSPWPIEASHKLVLPGFSRGTHQARAAVAASVRIGSRTVVVYSVHLTSPWGMGGGGRARQVDAILAEAERSTAPVVLAGDFNSHGVGERVLARGFLWPTRNIGHSIGPFSYDHVFLRGFRLAEELSAGVAKGGAEGERPLARVGRSTGDSGMKRHDRHGNAPAFATLALVLLAGCNHTVQAVADWRMVDRTVDQLTDRPPGEEDVSGPDGFVDDYDNAQGG
jgi:hypothetical protein